MSASEIIEQICKLPVPEQDRVLTFLQNARNQREPGEGGIRYADDADFEKVADKVLREHADPFRRLAQ
jgi:hypothetical protein